MSANPVPTETPRSAEAGMAASGGGGEPPELASLRERVIVLETRFDLILPTLATKQDIADLRLEMAKIRGELHSDMEKYRGEMRAEMAGFRGEIRAEMEAFRGEIDAKLEVFRGEIHADMEKLRGDVRADMEKLRGDLRADMQNTFLGMMKWMIGLAVALFLSIAGSQIFMQLSLRALVEMTQKAQQDSAAAQAQALRALQPSAPPVAEPLPPPR